MENNEKKDDNRWGILVWTFALYCLPLQSSGYFCSNSFCVCAHALALVRGEQSKADHFLIVEYCFMPDISLFSILNYRPGDKSECLSTPTIPLYHIFLCMIYTNLKSDFPNYTLTHSLCLFFCPYHLLAHLFGVLHKADASPHTYIYYLNIITK